jgi:hypothetical protein
VSAVASVVLCVALTSPTKAQSFEVADFLKWELSSQRSYIDANVGMASLIAGQNDKVQGLCIDDWFYGDTDVATSEVIEIMKRFKEHHPRAVILAVVEKHCGKIALR